MSETRLVLDGEDAQAAGEQLLEEVVLLVVEGRASQGGDRLHRRTTCRDCYGCRSHYRLRRGTYCRNGNT